jgi:hypothetical protein
MNQMSNAKVPAYRQAGKDQMKPKMSNEKRFLVAL